MPQLTEDWTLAMKRCAELLDWTVETEGRTWVVTDPVPSPDLGPVRGNARFLLAHMVTVALSPRGAGLDPETVRRAIGLVVPRHRGTYVWPDACTATEVAALSQLYRSGPVVEDYNVP